MKTGIQFRVTKCEIVQCEISESKTTESRNYEHFLKYAKIQNVWILHTHPVVKLLDSVLKANWYAFSRFFLKSRISFSKAGAALEKVHKRVI